MGLGVVGAVSPAYAATDFTLSPSSGPSAGGTNVTLSPPGNFTAVAAGWDHSLALDTDGNAWAWGRDQFGRLGDGGDAGTELEQHSPVPVTMPTGVIFTAISASWFHSLALDSDGRAWAWGGGGSGELGLGNNNDQIVPMPVAMPQDVTFIAISAGTSFSIALDTDGNAWAWGSDENGRLGDGGGNVDRNTPALVVMPADVTFSAIAAGFYHSLALDTNGTAWAWGSDNVGQLGNGGPNVSQIIPVPVTMPPDVEFTSIGASMYHSLALDTNGNAWSWGQDTDGRLGNGDAHADQNLPFPVTMPVGHLFSAIVAGLSHSVALDTDGNAWACGLNAHGQLGDGAPSTSETVPAAVTMPPGVTFMTIDSDGNTVIALDTAGNTWTWGADTYGQLGNGSLNSSRTTPGRVAFDTVVTGVTFGGIAGTDLAFDAVNGTWSVTTPAHTPGAVDVVIAWQLNGVPMPTRTLTGDYTYTALLAATGPDTDNILSLTGTALALLLLGLTAAAWPHHHRRA